MGLQVERYDEDERSKRGESPAKRSVGRRDGGAKDAASAAEGELAAAKDQVAALESSLANQARAHADLIHLLSHELRTPITVIKGFSRLLLEPAHGSLSDRQVSFVDQSLKACERLERLVADLLEASPESPSPFCVTREAGDLDATIRTTLEAFVPQISEREIRVDLDLDTPIPTLEFDRARIEQLLANLLMNAIRYGRSNGSIRIGRHVRREELGSAPAQACIEVFVEDDGPGVPAADRERVFEAYVRGEGHSDCAGMGIGLAICERIVTAHAGTIRVEDGTLGGARFVFGWPLEAQEPVAARALEER